MMSPENSEPIDLKQKIERILEKKRDLIHALERLLPVPETAAYAKSIRNFVTSLKRDVSADDFLEDPLFSIWLPVLLVYGRSSESDSKGLQEATESIVRLTEDRRASSGILAYVAFVFLLVLAVVLLICSTVIPVFAEMFREFGLRLPIPTLALVWVGERLGPRSFAIFGVGLSTVLMLWLAMRVGRRLFIFMDFASFVRGFSSGSSTNLMAMSRFVTTLAELLRIDTPIAEAISVAGRSSQSPLLARSASRLSMDLRTRGKPSRFLSTYFPRLLFYGLDPNGNGIPCLNFLNELGVLYSERARNRADWVTGFVVPIATVLLGAFVGFVAIALFMPLISLITSLSFITTSLS